MKITIELESPLHLGSGQADVNTDADIVHDELGLPYFPAKRFRGLLYESAVEVAEMGEACHKAFVERETVEKLFGRQKSDVRLILSDFRLKGYDQKARRELADLEKIYAEWIQPADVLETYTSLRFQTQIDPESGTAKDNSLRNIRVLDPDTEFGGKTIFEGELEIRCPSENIEIYEDVLLFALRNLRYAGGKRNRGFGKISCISDVDNASQRVKDRLERVGK